MNLAIRVLGAFQFQSICNDTREFWVGDVMVNIFTFGAKPHPRAKIRQVNLRAFTLGMFDFQAGGCQPALKIHYC